jgi:hypothetical protein
VPLVIILYSAYWKECSPQKLDKLSPFQTLSPRSRRKVLPVLVFCKAIYY